MPEVLVARAFGPSPGAERRGQVLRDEVIPSHVMPLSLRKRRMPGVAADVPVAVASPQAPAAGDRFGPNGATSFAEVTLAPTSELAFRAEAVAHSHGDQEVGLSQVKLLPTPARSEAAIHPMGGGVFGGPPVSPDDAAEALRLRGLVAKIAAPSSEPGATLRAVAALRQELAARSVPPVSEVIALGGADALVSRLCDSSAAVQLDAMWALTNLTAGTSAQTASVLGAGLAEAVIMVLKSDSVVSSAELCKQCLWVLGNVASDQDVACRDHLLQIGILDALGELFGRMPEFAWGEWECAEVLQVLTSLMSSLCQGQPAPALKEVDCTIDYFVQVLQGADDEQMVTDAFVGLASLLEGSPDEECLGECSRRLLSAGFAEVGEAPPVCHPVVARAVQCFRFGGAASLPTAALRFVGALLTASGPECTTVAIAAGTLPALKSILCDVRTPVEIRLRASWALANVAAAGPSAAERLVDEPGLWPALCEALERSQVIEFRRECAWVLASVLCNGPSVLARLEARKALRRIATALRVARGPAGCPELLSMLLSGSEALLAHGGLQPPKGGNRLRATAEECGFFAEVELLRRADGGIGRRASELLTHPRFACAGAENENLEPSAENVPPQQLQKISSRKFGDIM